MRAALALLFYALAFVCLYGATNIAPDMRWPTNATEMVAAQLMVVGVLVKLFGHIMLLSHLER